METHEIYRPDVTGWRRDRVPTCPTGRPILIRPDWVCEVLSESDAGNDVVVKPRVFQRNGLPHYWVADPVRKVLTVHRWQPDGYLVVLTAPAGEVVRTEPLDAIELAVGILFGEEIED